MVYFACGHGCGYQHVRALNSMCSVYRSDSETRLKQIHCPFILLCPYTSQQETWN